MDDEQDRPAEGEARRGDEPVGQTPSRVAQGRAAAPEARAEGEPADDGETPGDRVPDVVESAAELGLGALIAPFTGGETVTIVGSVASMLEAGVDRLTHLGEHESPPDVEATDEADGGGAADGSG